MQGELIGEAQARGPWWADGPQPEQERWARWACWCVEGVGATRMGRLHAVCKGSLAALWEDKALQRRALAALGAGGRLERALAACWAEPVDGAWGRAQEAGGSPLFVGDEAYPVGLRDLEDAPIFLCVSGELGALSAPLRLAMVGSREAPERWLGWTQEVARQLGRAGVCVVSGGAFGVDAAAHEGALAGGGQTVAVMAGGLGALAPRGNMELFERVERCGALVSEYPPHVEVRKQHFARRNRLIAALSQACVVVRAREGSGALYTAQAALALGRPLGAAPFDVLDEGAAGGVALLARSCAVAVRGAADMLALCGAPQTALREAAMAPALEPPGGLEGALWAVMGGEAMSAEEVAQAAGRSVGEVLGAMLELELGGWVSKEAGRAAWRRERGRLDTTRQGG